MNRILCVILSLMLLCMPAALATEGEATASETATGSEALGEGQILLMSYANATAGYYIAVPEDWAFVGYDSLKQGLTERAFENGMDGATLSLLKTLMTPENNVLYAFSKRGESLIVNFGDAEGADMETLIKQLPQFKKALSEAYVGISFTDESGEYQINELTNALLICANYQGYVIRQYHMIVGTRHFVFTFTNTDKTTSEISMSNFGIINED